jgi:nucleoside-diphosphate-sugar epimerase
MKCAVFGAGGFIGRHLAMALRGAGHSVKAYDLNASQPGTEAEVARLDVLRDEIDLRDVNAVFYLSQSPHYRDFPRQAGDLFGVNVVGALRVAEAALDAGAHTLFYASTGSVYAPSFAPMAEDAAVRRNDAYALSKLTAEDALRLLRPRLQTVCMRFFGVFGSTQTTMLVPTIASRVRDGQIITLQPGPTGDEAVGLHIALTHVDDVTRVCSSLLRLTAENRAIPPILNVAHPHATGLRELGSELGSILGKEPRFEVAANARTSDFRADVTLLRSLVPIEFTPLREALRRTFA